MEYVSGDFDREGVDLKITHVRTGDLFTKLRSQELDLVCGSVVVTEGEESAQLAPYEVMEWRRSGLSLLTNLPPERLPGGSFRAADLPRLPLVVSTGGLIDRFLTAWYGSDYRQKLTVAAEIEAAHYGFELLRSGVVSGAMLVTRGLGEAASDGHLPEAEGLRTLEVTGDVGPRTEVLVGVFTRCGERASYGPEHPLNRLWEALSWESERWWLRP
ncbi:hypothetical protein [Streptomyces noursei]|uniref:hypothetical protein n=1 Tax=Streptomyces noursei TaxID=1971 RepID=UPI0035E23AF5